MIAVSTPKTTPSSGSSPYAPLPTTPEIRTTPTNTTGIAASARFSGRSPSEQPREQSHEHDLDVAEHGREPGAHRLDRVVPEGEVGGEHHARAPERQALAQRARPVAALARRQASAAARAARRRSGRTPPWRATPRQAARGSPRTRSRRRRARRRVRAGQSRANETTRGYGAARWTGTRALDARRLLRRVDHVRARSATPPSARAPACSSLLQLGAGAAARGRDRRSS